MSYTNSINNSPQAKSNSIFRKSLARHLKLNRRGLTKQEIRQRILGYCGAWLDFGNEIDRNSGVDNA